MVDFGGKPCFMDLEVCDPVENDEYNIQNIPMSNFILPSWFEPAMPNQKYDYLGKLGAPCTLDSGGYFGYSFNLKTWNEQQGRNIPVHQITPRKYSRRVRRTLKRI